MTTNSDTPRLSVIITCYNLGKFLSEAVDSALATDYSNVEVIVVDDGSTDAATLALLDSLESTRGGSIAIIRQENEGVSAARNKGIRRASGTYILPLDGDDRVRPSFPASAVRVLEGHPEVGVVYGKVQRFGGNSDVWESPEFLPEALLAANCLSVGSVFRRKAWEECGGYDPFMITHEDWEFWINVMKRGWRFHRLDEIAYDYRARPGSLVTQWEDPELRARLLRHLCRKHFDLYARHLPAVLAAKETSVQDLRRMAATQEQCINEQTALLADLRTRNEEAERHLAEHGEFINKLTDAFREIEGKLDDARARAARAEDELAHIHGTRWWKLACLVGKLRRLRPATRRQ